MMYVKNVPPVERTLRLLAAAGTAVAGFLLLSEPWQQWAAAGSAAIFAATGLFGFCPMCYMAGRKLANRTA